ncbi:hypothetical protein ACIQ6Y_19965 [Streptomyces sp. NPDC096205]|uniref:hypothetical protein n=1 Tax=Streptomyces sp. NPDC096205 TaxID=3366081 RepID=UPI003805C1BA
MLRTGSNCGESPRCPAEIAMDMGFWALFDAQVQLGGQAAARAPEPVVVRLDGDAAGRLLVLSPVSRPGGVLVGPAHVE